MPGQPPQTGKYYAAPDTSQVGQLVKDIAKVD
jgi:hypothetical protein